MGSLRVSHHVTARHRFANSPSAQKKTKGKKGGISFATVQKRKQKKQTAPKSWPVTFALVCNNARFLRVALARFCF